jgi:stress response protein YsnF
MNTKMLTENPDKESYNTRVSSLLEKLRRKVKNFSVLDKQGELVGEVKDLVVGANRQLNFVISKLGEDQGVEKNGFFLLLSNLIKKIDAPTKSVSIDLDKSEINYMPEYLDRETGMIDQSPENPAPSEANLNLNREAEMLVDNSEHYAARQVNSNDPDVNLEKIDRENTHVEKFEDYEEIIRLLEERVVVNSTKRKIGEVIVRKEIEIRMVQVPIRCEKLIVEQVSPEHKQLAEIDLGHGDISGFEFIDGQTPVETTQIAKIESGLTVSGDFHSPKIASLLLNAIALERNNKCKQVRVTIVVEDEEHQKKYQDWFERTTANKQSAEH